MLFTTFVVTGHSMLHRRLDGVARDDAAIIGQRRCRLQNSKCATRVAICLLGEQHARGRLDRKLTRTKSSFSVRKRTIDQSFQFGRIDRLEHKHTNPRQQRTGQGERRILCSRANQHDGACFHVRKKRILLRAIEPVNFVDKQNCSASGVSTPLGFRDHFTHARNAIADSRE